MLLEPPDIEIGVAPYARIDLFVPLHGPFVVITQVLGADSVEVEGVLKVVGPRRIDFEAVFVSARRPREVAHDLRMEAESVLAAVMNLVFDKRNVQAEVGRSVFQSVNDDHGFDRFINALSVELEPRLRRGFKPLVNDRSDV